MDRTSTARISSPRPPRAGAVGAIVDRAVAEPLPQIVVADTLLALQALAAAWRRNFELPVVAVAGSNGKTTTKEMIAAILSRIGPCMSTRGNLNNHIGVPLTLLRLDSAHRSAVVEIGANRRGDVAALMPLVRPSAGLVTNAGAEHLEGFGDLDGVAAGEGETIAGLAPEGTAVINADDAYADQWARLAGARRVVRFGIRAAADFVARVRGPKHRARRVRQSLHARLSARRVPDPRARRRNPQRHERRRRGRGRRRGRRQRSRTSRPASPTSARSPGACS